VFLSQETHQVSNPGYPVMGDTTNNVLLVKIEGLVWYTIYHHLLVVKGVNKLTKPFINQPTNG
jgi:hypothetical protein